MTIVRRGFSIRLAAGAIDVFLGAVVALLLSETTGRWFAERSIVMLRIGSPDTFWHGPVPMILGILGHFAHGAPFALLLVLLPEALFGAGPGKWLLGLHVTSGDGAPAAAPQRWLRWSIKCAGLWCMPLALILGSSTVAAVALAAVAVTLAGFLVAIGPRSLALHDRLADTAVFGARRAAPPAVP